MVALCATLSACAQTVWQDTTGNGRGGPEMQMDSANCQLYAQANTQQTDTSQCQQGKGQTGCILAGVIGNALAQGMTFNTCMQSQGWQQVQVASAAQKPAPEKETEVASAANDENGDGDAAGSDDIMADAEDAFADGDYATALDLYREAASDGDAEAENKVGLFYANGWGVKQDPKKATRWFRKADRDGSAYAKNNLSGLRQQHGGRLQPAGLLTTNQQGGKAFGGLLNSLAQQKKPQGSKKCQNKNQAGCR